MTPNTIDEDMTPFLMENVIKLVRKHPNNKHVIVCDRLADVHQLAATLGDLKDSDSRGLKIAIASLSNTRCDINALFESGQANVVVGTYQRLYGGWSLYQDDVYFSSTRKLKGNEFVQYIARVRQPHTVLLGFLPLLLSPTDCADIKQLLTQPPSYFLEDALVGIPLNCGISNEYTLTPENQGIVIKYCGEVIGTASITHFAYAQILKRALCKTFKLGNIAQAPASV